MRNLAFDKTALEWSCYGKLSHAFKRNLRHLFTDLDFSGRVEDAPLLEAVTFLQSLLRQGEAPRQIDPSAFFVSIIPTGLRDLHKKIDGLIGFQHPKHYVDRLIKPGRKAYGELICKEWPNIQRIMASLAQKDVTQANMVRMLGLYGRQNQTKKALWELDNLYRTLYILTFIDDVGLRQSVQKALNRGEAYHRFRRAISYVNAGKFRVKTETEKHIWNECSRLIANAIIYYNTLLLSRVHAQKQAAGDHAAADIVKDISPNAWQHVHLIGAFDFEQTESQIDIDALAARYDDPDLIGP